MAETGLDLNWAPSSKCDFRCVPAFPVKAGRRGDTSNCRGALTPAEGSTDVLSKKYIFVDKLTGYPLRNGPLTYIAVYFVAV
jgi:hypothetical protein